MTKVWPRWRRLWLSPPHGRGKVVVRIRHAVEVVVEGALHVRWDYGNEMGAWKVEDDAAPPLLPFSEIASTTTRAIHDAWAAFVLSPLWVKKASAPCCKCFRARKCGPFF